MLSMVLFMNGSLDIFRFCPSLKARSEPVISGPCRVASINASFGVLPFFRHRS